MSLETLIQADELLEKWFRYEFTRLTSKPSSGYSIRTLLYELRFNLGLSDQTIYMLSARSRDISSP